MNASKQPLLSTCMTQTIYFAVILLGLIISMTLSSIEQRSVFKPTSYALGSVQDTDNQTQPVEQKIQPSGVQFAENVQQKTLG